MEVNNMNTEYKGKWLYDIFLHGRCVGNQGDEAFDTKEEAEIDANEWIENVLSEFYGENVNYFVIDYYQAQY